MEFSHDTLRLEMAMATDVGRIRQRNEDQVRILPEAGAAVLADGMGGHQAGDEAARLAVEVIADEITRHEDVNEQALGEWIETANRAIRQAESMDSAFQGMGTTVVVAVCRGDALLFGYAGDSRLYRLRANTLEQLTRDHTLVQQCINDGLMSPLEAHAWIGRGLLTKGLGIDDSVGPDLGQSPLRSGETYLLCSDGLTDSVGDREIMTVLVDPGHSAESCANELVSLANAHGGPDNISVAVIRVHGETGTDT